MGEEFSPSYFDNPVLSDNLPVTRAGTGSTKVAERWPSGRRHQIANLAYWVTGTEGSNPSLSAKIKDFSALDMRFKLRR